MMIKVYLVGGAVRDKMMGIEKPKDLDYSVEAPSYDAMRDYIIRGANGDIFLETPQYYTIRARVPKLGAADFVLCRKDGFYSDGRRPDSVEPGTILDDLGRRDFTVNAMAIDVGNNKLIDPFGGQGDLKNRIINTVGKPMDRFNEDALRMLRALRFSITKDFSISPAVQAALGNQHLIDKLKYAVSADRKREEIARMFAHDTIKSLKLLHAFDGIRDAVFEEGTIWLKPTMEIR